MIQYSIGELLDKLIICNLKLFHTEIDIADMIELGAPYEDIEKLCDNVRSFNTLRNELIESINEFFEEYNNG